MTEYDRDRLSGRTVEDTDRERYAKVVTSLEDYKREIHGIPADEVVIEGEPFAPIPVMGTLDSKSIEDISASPIPSPLIPKNSRMGLKIFEARAQKRPKKKAA